MRPLLAILVLSLLSAGCTGGEDPAPPTPTAVSTPPTVPPSPTPAATPPASTPAATTPTPSPTPASPAPPGPQTRLVDKSFEVEIPAAVDNAASPPVYTSNCVRVAGDGPASLVGGRANATWEPTLGSAIDLELLANPAQGNLTRIEGPPPLSLEILRTATNITDVLLQAPRGGAVVQQKATISLSIHYLGAEPTFTLMGCTVRTS